MPIREFELFHGAVLAKLLRANRPVTLAMIETRPREAWSTYRVNDATNILVKHSLRSRSSGRQRARAWQFVFSPNQMRQLQTVDTWAVLVCGGTSVGTVEMDACFLDPDELRALLDLSSAAQQSLTVKRVRGRSLRAFSARTSVDVIVPRNRLETWDVPGS